MILTENLIQEIIKKSEKCTYINDDYVILYKRMEVCDDLLDLYLSNICSAQKSGIQIPRVIEYKLIGSKKDDRSLGIFLEERAKGNVLNVRGIILRIEKEYNFNQIIKEYLKKVESYLLELEKRAKASQNMYDKLLNDFVSLYDYGLKPDPNSLNYLFDDQTGFTIIDPYISADEKLEEKSLFRFITNIVYGVSRPNILIKTDKMIGFYDLPIFLKNRLDDYSSSINKKICLSFEKKGYSKEYIVSQLEENKMRFYTGEKDLTITEVVKKLQNEFCNLRVSKVNELKIK